MTKTLPRRRKFLDIDVYTASLRRLRHIYALYDVVIVSFSGGKDSTALLHLCREVALGEMGQTRIPVIFRDQEFLPNAVIDYVDGYRQLPWIDMRWYCFPSRAHMYILGEKVAYQEWDPERPPVRPKPPWAIDLDGMHPEEWPRWGYDAEFAHWFPRGKICVLTGLRASESLVRYRACVNKLHDNYLTAVKQPRVMMGKPIYDWQENDILYYLASHGIPWCTDYDAQHAAGQQHLRVSPPLHSEAAKRFATQMRIDPDFANRIIALFPPMATQGRYQDDAAALQTAIIALYAPEGYDGVRRYIREHTPDAEEREKALAWANKAERMARGQGSAYPPEYALRQAISGQYQKTLQPLARDEQKDQRRPRGRPRRLPQTTPR